MLMGKLPEFLTELESTILRYLLQDDTEENRTLADQLKMSSLQSRERNGYGFFTNFAVPDSAPRCTKMNFELGNVCATVGGQLCGFILFVRGAKADFLEGFPLGADAWPESEDIQNVREFRSSSC
jgi:hypothetical protein